MRIQAPNYTQTPNDLFDNWLPKLKEIELKVLLVIMRKTFGWHKSRDQISLSQLEKFTGSDRKNILLAIDGLIEKGLVKKEVEGENGTQKTYYELIIQQDSNNSDQWQSTTPPSGNSPPPPSGNLPLTKETLTKETQQKKVVVVSDEKSKSKKNEEKFTKDDLYMNCVRLKKDWTDEEMTKALKIYESSSYPISNPLSYIEGIIKKNRQIENIKQQEQECNLLKESTLKQKSMLKGNSNKETQGKNKSQNTSSEILDKDIGKRLFANWKETL